MPTKDSKLITLRLGNRLLVDAKALADKEDVTLHHWCVTAIQVAVDLQGTLYRESNAPEAHDQFEDNQEGSSR